MQDELGRALADAPAEEAPPQLKPAAIQATAAGGLTAFPEPVRLTEACRQLHTWAWVGLRRRLRIEQARVTRFTASELAAEVYRRQRGESSYPTVLYRLCGGV